MKYKFPFIKHINDVLPHIKDAPEFKVMERDHYTVVNYVMSGVDTFLDGTSMTSWMRRECRGLIFDNNGNVLSRRFHKFFNVNERDETQLDKIDLASPHVILEKLDGSMITPLWLGDHLRWGTKAGVTDVAMLAEDYVSTRPQYEEFAEDCRDSYYTPIFEFCSRRQRIVVDYPTDQLVLLAVRHNNTGEYVPYTEMLKHAAWYGIPVVKVYPGTVESMKHLVSTVVGEQEGEGWIVRFDDGHMVKIKNELYVRLHKVKERIEFERHVVDIIINEEVDDLKPFMLEADLKRINIYEEQFWKCVKSYCAFIDETYAEFATSDRKVLALSSREWDSTLRALIFKKYDGKDTLEILLEVIKKNLSTNIKFSTFKHLFLSECDWLQIEED
jgi:RNA ligase